MRIVRSAWRYAVTLLLVMSHRPFRPAVALRLGHFADPHRAQGSAQLRSQRNRQDRRSLRRLLSVRLRQLAQGQSHPLRPVPLGPLQRAFRAQSLPALRRPEKGRRFREDRRSSENTATSSLPAWTPTSPTSSATSPSSPLFARIDAIKDKKDLAAVAAYLDSKTPTGIFFRFGVEQDQKDSSKQIEGIHQGGLTLPDRDYYLQDDPHMQDDSRQVPRLHRRGPETHRRIRGSGQGRRRSRPRHRNRARQRRDAAPRAARSRQALPHHDARRTRSASRPISTGQPTSPASTRRKSAT